jgi:hypothetical protein
LGGVLSTYSSFFVNTAEEAIKPDGMVPNAPHG